MLSELPAKEVVEEERRKDRQKDRKIDRKKERKIERKKERKKERTVATSRGRRGWPTECLQGDRLSMSSNRVRIVVQPLEPGKDSCRDEQSKCTITPIIQPRITKPQVFCVHKNIRAL